MRSEPKTSRSAINASGAHPSVIIVGERIPCRDAKRRVWQALDLLQLRQSRLQVAIAPRMDRSQNRARQLP
jgi:hypothetical protein